MTWPFVRRHREGAKPGRADRLAALATLLLAPLGPMALAGTAGATSSGLTTYPSTGIFAPASITTGPDGALWFTNGGNGTIGRITTDGVISNYSGPGIHTSDALEGGITTGPDGALWLTNGGSNGSASIGRITTAGTVTTFSNNVYDPQAITTGPDGNVWEADYLGTTDQTTTSGTTTRYDGNYPEEGSPPVPTATCGSPVPGRAVAPARWAR